MKLLWDFGVMAKLWELPSKGCASVVNPWRRPLSKYWRYNFVNIEEEKKTLKLEIICDCYKILGSELSYGNLWECIAHHLYWTETFTKHMGENFINVQMKFWFWKSYDIVMKVQGWGLVWRASSKGAWKPPSTPPSHKKIS